MKKTLLPIFIALCIMLTGVFAYTPSTQLQQKISEVTLRFNEIITEKGEIYRDIILSRIAYYRDVYVGDEEKQYILDELETGIIVLDIDNKYMGEYSISDDHFGTSVEVTLEGNTRSIKVNALPNHETGEFPNSGNPNAISAQSLTYNYPLEGKYTGNQTWAHIPGVAVNGVKFEPETAERVECQTGESYKIEAFQDFADLGFDFNNAHVQPTGEYHYHGSFAPMADMFEGDDLIHVGFAADGFLIYYSKKGTFKPSYGLSDEMRQGSSCSYRNKTVSIDNSLPDGTYTTDWKYVPGLGDLDACNGIMINGEYSYIISDQYPYIGRCLNGEYTQTRGPNAGSSGRMGPPPAGAGGFPPPRR